MSSGSDELIECLLYDIALSGPEGIGAQQLEDAVRDFHAKQKVAENVSDAPIDLLFSDTPPTRTQEADEDLALLALDWLCKHPDIEIRDAPIAKEKSNVPGKGRVHNSHLNSAASSVLIRDRLGGKRIFATVDRIWRALTGHGIDNHRIAAKEFECLTVIAASGCSGILQPQLCRETGQDKRSVPKRTDVLAQKGYITKETVISNRCKTSLLKLKRFAEESSVVTAERAPASAVGNQAGRIIYYDTWYNETMRIIKENGNIVSMDDLRIGLGIEKKKWETRILIRCIRRLDEGGLLRRFTGRMQNREGDPMKRISTGEDKRARAIELLREPTSVDQLLWTQSMRKSKSSAVAEKADIRALSAQGGTADPDDDGDASDADENTNDLDLIKQRIPPQWIADIPYPNLLFRIIDQTGPAGTSSMVLNKLATGPVWRRPLDEIMGKLTDVWRFSQPSHLRHFTLVRDTGVQGRTAHYQYRSLANFKRAIEDGNASWAAVGGDPADTTDTPMKQRWTQLDMDEWGFPRQAPNDLVGGDGGARLADFAKPTQNRHRKKGSRESFTAASSGDAASSQQNRRPGKRKLTETPTAMKKRHKMEAKEQKEFDRFAQGLAERQALIAVRKTLLPHSDHSIVVKDLPAGQVQGMKAAILARDRPGLYINPPGSRLMKQENFFQRGRPRNCMIAVIRSEKLRQLPWFNPEQNSSDVPKIAERNPTTKRKVSFAADPQSPRSPAPGGPPSSVSEPPSKKQRLARRASNRNGTVMSPSAEDIMQESRDSAVNPSNQGSDTQVTDTSNVTAMEKDSPPHAHIRHDSKIAPESTLLSDTVGNKIVGDDQTSSLGDSAKTVSEAPHEIDPVLMEIDAPELSIATELAAGSPNTSQAPKAPSKRPKKGGTLRDGGFVAEQRTKAILDAVRLCNGVFPGNNEIWYVVTTFWQKRYNKSPDKHTIERAVTNLIANGSLKRFTFQFRTKRGLMQTRSILAEPGINPQTPVFRDLQKNIKDTWPNQYLPREVEVDEEMRRQAGNMYGRRKTQEPDHAKASSRTKSELRPKLFDRYPVDTEVTVRQTDYSAELSDEEARAQGFENAQAYRLYCVNKNSSYRRFWGKQGILPPLNEPAEDGAAISKMSKATKETQSAVKNTGSPNTRMEGMVTRAPLSTLRVNKRGVIRKPTLVGRVDGQYLPSVWAHSRLDPRWLASSISSRLKARTPQRRHWETSPKTTSDVSPALGEPASMMAGPDQVFHVATGTFGTLVPVQQPKPTSHWSYPDGTVDRAVSRCPTTSHAKAKQFVRDVNRVQRWELDLIEKGQMYNSPGNEPMFVHHVLDEQETAPRLGPIVSSTFFQEASPPQPDGPSQPAAAATSQAANRPKRKYTRRAKRVKIVEEGKESHSEVRPTRKLYAKRDRHSSASFKDVDRLVTAYALGAVVCGGINQSRMNWSIIAHILGFRYDAEFLRRRWSHHGRYRTKDAEKIRDAIREPFLKAYEEDRLPHIDYQDLAKTDWPAMFKWVEREVLPILNGGEDPVIPTRDLPASRAQLETEYKVVERPNPYELRRDEFFTVISDQGRRQKLLQFDYGSVLPGSPRPAETPNDENILLKSWIRAVAATKIANYDSDAATQKLNIFPNSTIASATKDLVDARIILRIKKGRQRPGRNFQIHNETLLQFRRWPGRTQEHRYLRDVARARSDIVSHLSTHDRVDLVPTSTDPPYIVLTNMLAKGHLRLAADLPPRDDSFESPHPKLSPWSYGGYNYETKKVPISRLRFPLFYAKTPAYSPLHDLKPGVQVPLLPRPVPGERGSRIPLWVDIHGRLMEDVWEMCVRSVMHLLVFRPGYDAGRMESAHRGRFGAWEIEILLGWMEKVGIAVRCGAGRESSGEWKGGWRAGEFWYCAFLPEVAAGWRAVGEESG